MTFITEHEATIRLSIFVGVFVLMALLEARFPKKRRVMARKNRWGTNLLLVVVNSSLLRVLLPILAIDIAWWSSKNDIGLLNWLPTPSWFEILLTILLLDMLIYLQHVAFHKLPIFWQFHKVHHADRDIDVTTGLRFHPVEIVLSMLFKFACIILLGANVVGVILFEVLLNASAMFNHANMSLPGWLDRKLRMIAVTPDVHRVHHSAIPKETDSNYGFFLSIWDRIFRTYRDQPRLGHESMTIGLNEYQTSEPNRLLWCLAVPLKRANHYEKV